MVFRSAIDCLSFYVIEQALNNPLVADLVVHSMGYFPKRKAIILIVRPVVESTF